MRIRHLPVAASTSVALLAGLIVWRAYAGAMRPNRPVGDRIVGAVCVYLLIGLAWAKVYETLDVVAPGSFRFPADTAWATPGLPRYTYVSFITLATVGLRRRHSGHGAGGHPRLARGRHRPALPRHHGRPAGGAVAGRGARPRFRPAELTLPPPACRPVALSGGFDHLVEAGLARFAAAGGGSGLGAGGPPSRSAIWPRREKSIDSPRIRAASCGAWKPVEFSASTKSR